MPELKTGGVFPPAEDLPRLSRYRQARYLISGEHSKHLSAERINDKLRDAGPNIGIVWITLNFPAVIANKFADLQVLRAPIITLDDEKAEGDFRKILTEDVPDLNSRLHHLIFLKRSLGDGVLLISRDAGQEIPGKGIVPGGIDLRVVDPSMWFPVADPADPLKFTAHQIAWVDDVPKSDSSSETEPVLRVDRCEVGRIIRTAFALKGDHKDVTGARNVEQFTIREEIGLSRWPTLVEQDVLDDLGDFPCIHVPNGIRLEPGSTQYQWTVTPFGRSDYEDSGSIFDEVNWRLSTWSDANDIVSHPPRIIPSQYQQQEDDEHSYGRSLTPSRWTKEFMQGSKSGEAGEVPQYMGFALDHLTLKDGFEQAFLMACIRHEMAPALLGYQMGNEKESGEAKSLGMGQTEAACSREQLQLVPGVNRALNVAARLRGIDSKVTTHWQAGLPKSETEMIAETKELRALKVITQREAIERLNPHLTEQQIDAKLKELAEERAAEAEEFEKQSPFNAKVGRD